jgi:NitT/TauT family transport system permease protein
VIRAIRQSAAPIAVGLFVLGLWQAACMAFHIPRILLPAPTAIAAAFAGNLPLLGADFVQTVLRSMLPGFAIGSGAGFIVGLLVDASPFLRRSLASRRSW